MQRRMSIRVLPMLVLAGLIWACGGSEPERPTPPEGGSQELLNIASSLEQTLAGGEDGQTTPSESGEPQAAEETVGVEETDEPFVYPGQELLQQVNATPEPTPTPTPTAAEKLNLTFDHSPMAPDSLPKWSYEGETGPEFWGDLGESCATCGEGQAQSPVNLTGAVEADLPNPVFEYGKSTTHIMNTGHSIQVNVEPGSLLNLDGQYYELAQFHMHAPGEHTIDGRTFQAEMHFVHRGVDGDVVVVAVMIQKGTKNEAYAKVLKILPAEKDMEFKIEEPAEIASLLPRSRTAYRYEGSLTTPPCTEGVKWVVMTDPVGLSIAQLDPFLKILEGNNRPVQPLNDRTLQVDVTP